MLVIISSMSVPICNRFHTKQDDNGKITSFYGVSLFDALVRGEPPYQVHKILSRKTTDLEAAHSEDFMILACTVLAQYNGQTAMAMTREALCYRV